MTVCLAGTENPMVGVPGCTSKLLEPQEAESHTPPAGPAAWPLCRPVARQFALPRPLSLLQD